MKTKKISAMIIITAAMLMGCKKNGTEPVNNPANSKQFNSNLSSDAWITSASVDGISGVLIEGPYKDWIQPKNFVTGINNMYFPLVPGDTLFYLSTSVDAGVTTVEDIYVTTTHDIKVILGINCVVVHDYVTDNADGKLLEDTYDWYAQDVRGNVWYFGENTKKYNPDGTYSTEGSFTAGIDGAKGGIIMPGKPHFGQPYHQEYYVGHAEDQGKNLSANNTVAIGYGTFTNCLKTGEYTVLNPSVIENKWYAPGIGHIQTDIKVGGIEHSELIRIAHE